MNTHEFPHYIHQKMLFMKYLPHKASSLPSGQFRRPSHLIHCGKQAPSKHWNPVQLVGRSTAKNIKESVTKKRQITSSIKIDCYLLSSEACRYLQTAPRYKLHSAQCIDRSFYEISVFSISCIHF